MFEKNPTGLKIQHPSKKIPQKRYSCKMLLAWSVNSPALFYTQTIPTGLNRPGNGTRGAWRWGAPYWGQVCLRATAAESLFQWTAASQTAAHCSIDAGLQLELKRRFLKRAASHPFVSSCLNAGPVSWSPSPTADPCRRHGADCFLALRLQNICAAAMTKVWSWTLAPFQRLRHRSKGAKTRTIIHRHARAQ